MGLGFLFASNILKDSIQMLNDKYSNQKYRSEKYALYGKINLIMTDLMYSVMNPL
jgi:hypothetical protein